jgi:drug/metabolite transporter (DMT)-like permease
MKRSPKTSTVGVGYALVTAICFGSSIPMSKFYLASVSAWMLAGLMFLGAGLGLSLIYLVKNWVNPFSKQVLPSDYGWLSLAIAIEGIVAPILITVGLETTPSAVASLLLNFECVFTAILAWTVFKQPLHRRVLTGVVIATTGGVILSANQSMGQLGLSWGALAVLGSCFAWALASNLTIKFADRNAVQIALLKTGIAGMINVSLALLFGQSLPPINILLPVLLVGFIGYGISTLGMVLSLRNLGAARTGAYLALSPLVGVLLAIAFLHEPVTPLMIGAALLMMVGAILCA